MTTNTFNRVRGRANRDAFALVEALVVALVIGLLVAVLVVSGERARRTAMMGEDLSNLRQIGQLTGQYANDFEDKIWSFSWKAGQSLSQFPDLNNAFQDLEAAANQAIDIIRRLANRDAASMPKVAGWFAHAFYNHLPLMEYAGYRPATLESSLPANRLFIGSGDRNRLLWISDVEGFEKNKFLPNQPPMSGSSPKRWPYSSSYRMPLHFFSPSFGYSAIRQGTVWNQYVIPGITFDTKCLSHIDYPSQKVLFHESHGRHHGKRQPYFSVSSGEARVPVLTVDGAADIRATRDGNAGWQPANPTSLLSTKYQYIPNSWDPPVVGSSSFDPCDGFYTYTRSAEKGRDFGGPEVPHQP